MPLKKNLTHLKGRADGSWEPMYGCLGCFPAVEGSECLRDEGMNSISSVYAVTSLSVGPCSPFQDGQTRKACEAHSKDRRFMGTAGMFEEEGVVVEIVGTALKKSSALTRRSR